MREITLQRKEVVGGDSKMRKEVAGHGGERLRVRRRVGDTCKSTRYEMGQWEGEGLVVQSTEERDKGMKI
ncbi:mediator of RNA polymerase II transcription subunit 25-like [Pyrus ussuriensis x Pyrus communis]|uniref:Mediator of RNA polymerase II transcription subunit 25-like n=1 Tax=Pyrus ussuriensis x Pyrus communis TaxID=2448454 RepID=A0A5N5GB31_9ROSA|nr:mediator of RNA polymerase II transcription subunit 25-like [Pyrus ussuriensis x Pyrus communis]